MKTTPSRAIPPHHAASTEPVYETGGSDPDFYFPPRRESRSLAQRMRKLSALRTLFAKPGRHPGA